MDGSGHRLPLEWHPAAEGPYGYDPYTNTFLPLPCYGYGWDVEYSWNQQRGPMQNYYYYYPYSSSSSVPLDRPPLAAARRGRGGGRHAQRGRGGGRHRATPAPRQHGGRGLLGSDPSSQRRRPSQQLPSPGASTPDEPPPAQGQPPVPVVPLPPENNEDPTTTSPPPPPASSSSPSSHAMAPPPVSDPVKDSHVADVSMTAAADAKRDDDAQHDVLVAGLGGSSSAAAATDNKRLLPPLDPPALLMKSSDADVSMARRDDDLQGDVLGLSVFLAKKRLLSTTKASSLPPDAAEEEAKAAARKKTRLGWGQGLAKYENRFNKDDETAHTLVAHDGASGDPSPPPPGSKGHGDNNSLDDMDEMRVSHVTAAPAFSKGSSRPLTGSKGHSDNNSLDDMAEMRVSEVATAPALFFKGSSHPLSGDLDDPGKNGSISSMTEKAVSAAEVPSRFSRKHSPSPAGDDQNLMADGGIHDRGSLSQVHAAPRKCSPPPEENSDGIAVSELAPSLGSDAPPDESSMEFAKVQDIPQKVISECTNNIESNPRAEKVIVKMLQKPRKILQKNVLSEEAETNKLQGSKLKEWSEEEKDVFSEMIALFGIDFCKISAFLRHKTTADCMEYYFEQYNSECYKEAEKCLPTTVIQSQENCCNENDAAPLLSGIATVTATKNYERMKAEAEDEPVNQICHGSTADLLAHSLPDKGHGESSMDEHEHVTGKVLVGEPSAAPSPLGMRSSQAACLTISKTEAPVLENFNEESCSNEAVLCITKSSYKVKIANHGDEGNCVAGGSCGHDTLKIMSSSDEICAKVANGAIKGVQVRSGAKTHELRSSLKECNDAGMHHPWKATEKKLANSNIDDGRMAPSDMKNPSSKDNPCITSDPAATLKGTAFVQHMMEYDEAIMEKKESEKNDIKVKGKEGNNPVLCVASKHCTGIQSNCKVNSQKEMEKVDDSILSPERNGLNTDMENPRKDSSPCVPTNASVLVRDDGLIQRLRDLEAMYTYSSGGNKDKVKSKEGNPVHSVASNQYNGIQLSCNLTSQKGKGIMPSPQVNDLNAPPMQISNGTPRTYHLPSSSGRAALDTVHANSSYVAMDIDLNIPLDVTPLDVSIVDLVNSDAEASMGPSSEATDSDATIEIISPYQQTTTTVTQTAQQQPANQPGSIVLFGRLIYQAPSTGSTNHASNLGNQTVVVSSSNMPSNNPVVPMTMPRGRVQLYPSGMAATTSVWRSSVPNNQQGQQAVLTNRMLYGGSTIGAAAASQQQLQPGSSALVNMINQQRQQALVNMTPYSIMRGGVPLVPSHLMQAGSSRGAGFVNFNGFNSVQQQWRVPMVDTTSGVVLGYPFYYPGATANQAPAAAPAGTNNDEGASTSNANRAPPAAGRGRGRGACNNSWLSLRRN